MNPIPVTADAILELVEKLPPEERERLIQRLQEREKRRPRPSFYEARELLSGIKGSLANDIIADREDRP